MEIDSCYVSNPGQHGKLNISDQIVILKTEIKTENTPTPSPSELPKAFQHCVENVEENNSQSTKIKDEHQQLSKRKKLHITGIKSSSFRTKRDDKESALSRMSKQKTVKRRSFIPKLSRKKSIKDIVKFELELERIRQQISEPRLSPEEQKHLEDLVRIEKEEEKYRSKLKEILEDFGRFLLKNQMISNQYADLISPEFMRAASRERPENLEGEVQALYDFNKRYDDENSVQVKRGDKTNQNEQKNNQVSEMIDENQSLILFMCQNLKIDPRILKFNS